MEKIWHYESGNETVYEKMKNAKIGQIYHIPIVSKRTGEWLSYNVFKKIADRTWKMIYYSQKSGKAFEEVEIKLKVKK
jgi:hypothetical protein